MRTVSLLLLFGLLGTASAQTPESRYLQNVRQVTTDGQKNGEGYFSPDGSRIIFQSVRNGHPYYQIYTANADGSNVRLVSPGQGKTTCSYFSPDGKKVLYASTHLDPSTYAPPDPSKQTSRYQWDFDKAFDIFISDADGSNLVRLTDAPGYDAEGSFSSDGKSIVFTSERDGDLEIYTMDVDGRNPRRLTHMPGYDGGPFFSPDSRRIIWRHFTEDGMTAQVWTMNRDGSNQRRLTALTGMNWAPYFHPDGNHVVFTSNIGRGNFELYLMDSDGNDLQRLTYDNTFDGLPVFSPDGRSIMWTASRGGVTHLWRADIAPGVLNAPGIGEARRLRADVEKLASPEFKGRGTGTPESALAARYIAQAFKDAGIEPAATKAAWPVLNPPHGGAPTTGHPHASPHGAPPPAAPPPNSLDSYLQNYEVTAGVKPGKFNRLEVMQKRLVYGKDYLPLGFSESGRVDGRLVFAGYGITVPGVHDDYAGLDVQGAVVLVRGGRPKNPVLAGQERDQFKAINAKLHGATGVIIVDGPELDPQDDLRNLSDTRGGNSGLPVLHVRRGALKGVVPPEWLTATAPKPQPSSAQVSMTVDLVRTQQPTSNVVGIIKGGDTKLAHEVVVIGAHYDHLGLGGHDSLNATRTPAIHPGADDNASGVAMLMEVGRALAPLQGKLRRTVVLVAFSGEEMGLLGSSHFVSQLPTGSKIVAMVNLDMVGRMRNNRVGIGGVKTGSTLRAVLDKANLKERLTLLAAGGGFGPSDHASFYMADIPVLFFNTGAHKDYHRPSDTAEKLNYRGMASLSHVVFNTVVGLSGEDPAPQFVRDPGQQPGFGAGRRSLRGSLGAIPDYTAMESTNGMLVGDVMTGSPAEQAGLRKGDRIVRFDNIRIGNIYDYTFALQRRKPGDKVRLEVQRGNAVLKLEATLTQRQRH